MNIRNQIEEIFGRGYDWSYRWYRIQELFGFLPSYYEQTMIPAIVMGCMTNLMWYFIRFSTEGMTYLTKGELALAFVFWLVLFTCEDLVKSYIKHIKNDRFFL